MAVSEDLTPPPATAVSRALGWSTITQLISRAGTFGSGVVVARAVSSSEFGSIALTFAVVTLLLAVNDLGVIGALVRWRGDFDEAAPTAILLAVLSSGAFALAVLLLAGVLAAALGLPEAAPLLRASTVVLLLDAVSCAAQARLLRRLEQHKLLVAEMLSTVTYVLVAVGMAVSGAGAWSVIIARVISSTASACAIVALAGVPVRPRWDGAVARKLLSFGIPSSLAAVVTQGVLNVDYIVVAKLLGADQLGVYLLAFNLASWPTNLVGMAVGRIAFVGFARLAAGGDNATGSLPRAVGLLTSLLMPLVLPLGVLGPEVIRYLYGARWLDAVAPLRLLLVLGGLRIVLDVISDFVAAVGRPAYNLAVRVIWLIVLTPTLVMAAGSGLVGVGAAHVSVAVGVATPLSLVALWRCGVHPRSVFRHEGRPAGAAAASALAMVALLPVGNGLVRLCLVSAAGTVVYLAALLPGNALLVWCRTQLRPRALSQRST